MVYKDLHILGQDVFLGGKHSMVLILQEKRSLQPRHAIVGPSGAVLDVVLWERGRRRS